jgi:hypothetical protein
MEKRTVRQAELQIACQLTVLEDVSPCTCCFSRIGFRLFTTIRRDECQVGTGRAIMAGVVSEGAGDPGRTSQ